MGVAGPEVSPVASPTYAKLLAPACAALWDTHTEPGNGGFQMTAHHRIAHPAAERFVGIEMPLLPLAE